MVILQKMFAVFLVVFTGIFNFLTLPTRLFDDSKFDEGAFVAALNDKDVTALEAMCSQRLKDKYTDLTDKLAEFCDLLGETTDEAFIKGDFDDWRGVFQTMFEGIADRIGYAYVTGNYLLHDSSSGTAGNSEHWIYQLFYGNLRPTEGGNRFGDYRIFVECAKINGGKDRGITRLSLSTDWVHTDSAENAETLFAIEVPWA